MATTLTAEQVAARRCPSHTLDDIVAYEVRQTIVDGVIRGLDGPIVERIEGPGQYGRAIDAAKALREPGITSYALVDNVYVCGHTCRDY